ncbi:MAG: bifunctional DedA family/phosphatase PAP2 family protein [Nitrospirae bacterium]|nr:bifunctional DedA family/phosphatase PAP2 family protein [Nitrospirota bacterium]MDA8340550.1 bifunctional DedA family/phosphatase PAP2 family protein [Nitrospiraceae bacterium]
MEHKTIEFLIPHLNHWGYYVLFLMTFLETSAFLGLLVPGESMVVIAGLLASRGVLELGDVIWVASLGAITGDTVGYFIGYRFGEGFFLKYGKYFFFKKEYLDEAKGFFDKHGGKTVFIGRFMAWLRAFAPVVAGISRMHYPRFLFFNLAGGIVWATIFSLLGYFVGNSWDIIKIYLGRIGIFGFICGVIIIYLYFLFTKKKRLIKEKVSWLDIKLSSQMPKTWEFVKGRFSAGEWYGLNLTTALVFFILALFSFGEIVEDLIDKETLFYLDFKIQGFVEGIISPWITRFMVDITNIGGVYLVVITAGMMALYLLYKRHWWELFTLFLAVVMGEILLVILKLFFHRPRPSPQIVAAHWYSFPSGHAFSAMIVYGFFIYMAWRLIKSEALRFIIFFLSILLIILIGISRIYLNVHWLTDVLGGYAAGFAWLLFSIIMVNTIKQYYRRVYKGLVK